jgi:hypothetical protein
MTLGYHGGLGNHTPGQGQKDRTEQLFWARDREPFSIVSQLRRGRWTPQGWTYKEAG